MLQVYLQCSITYRIHFSPCSTHDQPSLSTPTDIHHFASLALHIAALDFFNLTILLVNAEWNGTAVLPGHVTYDTCPLHTHILLGIMHTCNCDTYRHHKHMVLERRLKNTLLGIMHHACNCDTYRHHKPQAHGLRKKVEKHTVRHHAPHMQL